MTEAIGLLAARRILLVEDEALIALAVEEEEVLGLGGAETYIAYHRPPALDVIDGRQPDFAVIDVNLTDTGNDYGIADTLADRGIPFISSSGHLAGELPDRQIGRPFVSKPMPQDSWTPSKWYCASRYDSATFV